MLFDAESIYGNRKGWIMLDTCIFEFAFHRCHNSRKIIVRYFTTGAPFQLMLIEEDPVELYRAVSEARTNDLNLKLMQ